MGKSELLKRSLEKGTSFLDLTRDRAEGLVKELVDAGVVRKGQAETAIDVVMERSRKRSEALGHLIRREVAEQLSAFGVATKDDIARLESKLESAGATSSASVSRVKARSGDASGGAITRSTKTPGAPKSSGQAKAPPAMKPVSGGRAGTEPKSPEAR